MQRTKLAERTLPDYTLGEEICNTVTHAPGIAFGIVTLMLCTFAALKEGDTFRLIGACVYGISLTALYSMSTIYHASAPGISKKILQILDHCTIYFLIAGTYTPILLGPFMEYSSATAWTILAAVWSLCIIATVFTAIDLNGFRKLSMTCYIGTGWIIIIFLKPAIQSMTLAGFLYLLYGGIAYTIGAVFYSIGSKYHKRYMHSVFHVFVLLGSVLQFVAVYRYCILTTPQ